jgi:hypothetical protein
MQFVISLSISSLGLFFVIGPISTISARKSGPIVIFHLKNSFWLTCSVEEEIDFLLLSSRVFDNIYTIKDLVHMDINDLVFFKKLKIIILSLKKSENNIRT